MDTTSSSHPDRSEKRKNKTKKTDLVNARIKNIVDRLISQINIPFSRKYTPIDSPPK